MKIIRKGWGTQKAQCRDCGTIFEFEDNETTIEKQGPFTFLCVKCPICGEKINFKLIK